MKTKGTNTKYTLYEVSNLLLNKKIKLVSAEYVNAHKPIKMKCMICNHTWNTKLNNTISSNHGCPSCAGNIRYTTQYVKDYIRNQNGEPLFDEYKNNRTKLNVKCLKCNNIWQPLFTHLIKGHWCPYCSGRFPHSQNYVSEYIKNKNGTLMDIYKNNSTKISVKCNECNTIWNPIFNNIVRGHWCPKCNSSKSQKLLYKICVNIFGEGVRFNYRDFDWLKSKTNRQELDIYIPELKLAIEYDGEQHFKPVRFGGITLEEAKQKLKYIKKLDKIKNKKMKEHTEDVKYFIRFNYKENITEKYVIFKLKELGLIEDNK